MHTKGDQIGPYRIIRKLGAGGFGEVWLAEKQTSIATTQVAIKIPLAEEVDLNAIKKEAAVWVQAGGHINILPLIEAHVYSNQAVFVSEYVSEGSLHDWLKLHGGKAPSIEFAVDIACGILTGLEHLHHRQIIHRDLKPANILLQGATPRITDFGISKILTSNSNSGLLKGTPSYMAPEAYLGERTVQTDIWSVGIILYQILSGQMPYPKVASQAEQMNQIMNNDPAPAPAFLPEPLQEVVNFSLQKDLSRRYKSASEMRKALLVASQRIYAERDAETVIAIRPGQGSKLPIAFVEAASRSKQKNQVIGMPLGPVEVLDRGEIQHFEGSKGFKCCIGRLAGESKAYSVRGVIYRKYMSMRGPNGHFGFPEVDEQSATISPFGTKGCYSRFEKGAIYYHETGEFGCQRGKSGIGKAFEVHGSIRNKYNSIGGTGSILGFPISDEYSVADGRQSDFEGGSLFWNRSQNKVSTLVRLLDTSYSDSPFLHGWSQYDGLPSDPNCLLLKNEDGGRVHCFFSFSGGGTRIAISYPDRQMPGLALGYKQCGITFRSKKPIHFYVWITTQKGEGHYISYFTSQKEPGFLVKNEWTMPIDNVYLDGEWHTLIIDMQQDAEAGFQEQFASLHWFCFRGDIEIANIYLADDFNFLKHSVINPTDILI